MDLRETVFWKTKLFLCHCEDHLTGISYIISFVAENVKTQKIQSDV